MCQRYYQTTLVIKGYIFWTTKGCLRFIIKFLKLKCIPSSHMLLLLCCWISSSAACRCWNCSQWIVSGFKILQRSNYQILIFLQRTFINISFRTYFYIFQIVEIIFQINYKIYYFVILNLILKLFDNKRPTLIRLNLLHHCTNVNDNSNSYVVSHQNIYTVQAMLTILI